MRRKRWVPAGTAVLVALLAGGVVVAISSATHAAAAAQEPPVNTAAVERGTLSDLVSQSGTLTYRARSDGASYSVIDRARGIYTELPGSGDRVDCGDVLYRVNDRPVLLLCGSTPAYRPLSVGDSGRDVGELNANLVRLGYVTRAHLDPSAHDFGSETAAGLRKLQASRGEDQTGSLELGQAVFLPESVRIATVTGELGGSARPGSKVLSATSHTLEVQLTLDPAQQGEVKTGDRAQITLPGNFLATGKVDRIGRVAQLPAGQDNNAGGATIPAYVRLDHPEQAHRLDQAPVQVVITTRGVENALSVPVTAIVGNTGGGFAVEAVRDGGRRDLVAVKLGLFDSAAGRVQIEGDLREGDRVVVGSS